jgi:hypothetical protein
MEANSASTKNRMVLLLIAGIPVTVILIATWLWYYVVEGELDLVGTIGTSNSGTLVRPPRQLDGFDLIQAQGLPLRYSDISRKWTFLVPGTRGCDKTCEEMLYTTRQIHVAMGKGFNRIQRVYLSDTPVASTLISFATLSDNHPAPASFSEYLAAEHRGMKAFTIAAEPHQTLLAEHLANPDTWYLVDPAGWIMMSYDTEVDYKDVISDLKFLLKNSSE